MNERIKELAAQARKEYLKLPTGYRPEQVGMYQELMEKFAELIVQDCVDIIEAQQVPIRPSPSGEIAARWTMDALRECRDAIKEHWSRPMDAELERRTGEPHVDGYPLYSLLPPPAKEKP